MRLKGQIQLVHLIGWAVALSVAAVGGFFTQGRIFGDKIDTIKTEKSQGDIKVAADIASLKTDLENVKINVSEVKGDVKKILEAVNKLEVRTNPR